MPTQPSPEKYFVELGQKMERYFNNRILLFKLQATKKISRLIAGLVIGFIISFILLLVLLFVSIAVGFYFSNVSHSYFLGFGIVSVFYLLLFCVIILFRKALIIKPVFALIIKILFNK